MLLSFVLFVFINLFNNSFSVKNNTNNYVLSNNSYFNQSPSQYLKYNWSNGTIIKFNMNETSTRVNEVDCFGLGSTIARGLTWFFYKNDGPLTSLDVKFFLTSRNQPRRVEVITGQQFGLEWTDFKIQRRTIIIVHGFLSHGEESWIKNMEKAFLLWGDVNVVVVDWSARGNTWNYYKAAVNARAVGIKINQFLTHIVNASRDSAVDELNWGSIHMIGHSLGAHICGLAANEFRKVPTLWEIKRITGLDPAQPCIVNTEFSLDINDAEFIDIIHTNGRLLSKLGFGLPNAIGHADFYPNGGRTQPGCIRLDGFPYHYLGIPKSFVEEAICSHGRSYVYFTESIIAATNQNGTFCGYNWDRTYRQAIEIINETCNARNCIEMGINADNYSDRGTFFVMTSSIKPFSELNNDDRYEISKQLLNDFYDDYLD